MTWEDIIKDMGDYKQTIDILRDAINQMEKTKNDYYGTAGGSKYRKMMEIRSKLIKISDELEKELKNEKAESRKRAAESRKRAEERRQNR